MNETMTQLRKSKSFREFFRILPTAYIENAAFAVLSVVFILPIIRQICYIVGYDDGGMMWISTLKALGMVSLVLFLLSFIKSVVCKDYPIRSGKLDFRLFFVNNRERLLIITMLLYMIISTAVTGWTSHSVEGDAYRREGLLTYCVYVSLFLCATLIENEKLKKRLFIILSVSAMVLAAVAITESCGVYISERTVPILNNHPNSIYYNSNHYGYFLSITTAASAALIVACEKLRNKLIFCVVTAINAYMLAVNYTLGAFVGVLFAFLLMIAVFSLCRKRFAATSLIPLVILFAVLFLFSVLNASASNFLRDIGGMFGDIKDIAESGANVENAGSHRWPLWKETFRLICANPFFGYGADGIGNHLLTSTGVCDRTHNEFMQYAVFFGIPAAILYVSGMMSAFLKGLKNRAALSPATSVALICVFSYLVSSFFGNTTYFTTPFVYIMLGLGVHHVGKNQISQ